MSKKSKIITLPPTATIINDTIIWDNNVFRKEQCAWAAMQLDAKPEHFIVLLQDLYSSDRRDAKGNLIKPTVAAKIREQGFQVRLIKTNNLNPPLWENYFRVVHIRTQERMNYFKLLFANEIQYCGQVKDLNV